MLAANNAKQCAVAGKTALDVSTGAGFAPIASSIRDPEAYEKFEEDTAPIILDSAVGEN